MENESTQTAVNQVYQHAANLLVKEKKSPEEVTTDLMDMGFDNATASIVVQNLQDQIVTAKKKRANNDMLYGALWCVGGTIATLAHIGFIFWGAIVFGGIQFFRGLANSSGN